MLCSICHSKKPTTLRDFLGLTGYYYKFVKNYATIDSPLRDLFKKDSFWLNYDYTSIIWSLKASHSNNFYTCITNYFTTPCSRNWCFRCGYWRYFVTNLPLPILVKNSQLRNSSTYIRELYTITGAIRNGGNVSWGLIISSKLLEATKASYGTRSSHPRPTQLLNQTTQLWGLY